ncbi:manganese efflux pump MntP family protein [Alloscardovia venturai]|uniref:Manganese efflux pump MntP family protein n=1 Tax=Alloscardovia venturai TaxID=1769421 RepID=A0ABW2Y584_9BIFI
MSNLADKAMNEEILEVVAMQGMFVLMMVVLGVTLSLDALTVTTSIGTRMHGAMTGYDYLRACISFGGIHALMLSAGYVLGDVLADFVRGVGPWISFILLAIVGIVMIHSAVKGDEDEKNLLSIPPLRWRSLIPLACACSIDAIAVGSSLGLTGNLPFGWTVLIVTIITIIAVIVGLKIGDAAGEKWEEAAQIIGGVALILIGIKSFF